MKLYQLLLSDRGVSYPNLSKKLGRSRRTLLNWRTGRTQPREPDLQNMSECFSLSVEDLTAPASACLQTLGTHNTMHGGNKNDNLG